MKQKLETMKVKKNVENKKKKENRQTGNKLIFDFDLKLSSNKWNLK